MFGKYLATQEDLKTIEEGLKFVSHPQMRFVFRDLSRIKKVNIISYDSQFIYIWKLGFKKLQYKIKHSLKIGNKWQSGWRACLPIEDVRNILPEEVKGKELISGGLLGPFISLQKEKKVPDNPYTTRESYLATIIHEFGHIYWNSFKLWWFSKKDLNTKYLTTALKLYEKKEKNVQKINLYFPSPLALGEMFAFCTEYYSSKIFWPEHKNALDRFGKQRIKKLIATEKKANLEKQNSVIEANENPHDFASVFGRIILDKYPSTWPQILTRNLSAH